MNVFRPANFIVDKIIKYSTSSDHAGSKGITIRSSAVTTMIILTLLLVMPAISSNHVGSYPAIAFAQSSKESESIDCGEDEVEEDGECVSESIDCGEDEVEEDGECVSESIDCGEDEVEEDGECVTNADIAINQEGIAGDDQEVKEGELVKLRGQNPTRMEGELMWEWKSDDINVKELFLDSDESTPGRDFFAPKVSRDTTFAFQLKVTDSQGNTAMDTTEVRIEDVSTSIENIPPIVRPGGDLINPQIPTESRPTKESSVVPQATQQFLTYENDTKAVKIQYPSDWEIIETKTNITFNSPSETPLDSFHETLRLVAIPYQNPLSDLTNQIITDAKSNLPSFELVDSRPTTLNGTSAHSLVYKYRDDIVGPVQQMAVLTVKNNTAYIIGYMAESVKYSNYLPVIQKMISSFEIGPFPPKSPTILIFP